MPKTRNSLQLTRNETIERLQAAKSYLGNKDRLAFMEAIDVLNQECEDELKEHVKQNMEFDKLLEE